MGLLGRNLGIILGLANEIARILLGQDAALNEPVDQVQRDILRRGNRWGSGSRHLVRSLLEVGGLIYRNRRELFLRSRLDGRALISRILSFRRGCRNSYSIRTGNGRSIGRRRHGGRVSAAGSTYSIGID